MLRGNSLIFAKLVGSLMKFKMNYYGQHLRWEFPCYYGRAVRGVFIENWVFGV